MQQKQRSRKRPNDSSDYKSSSNKKSNQLDEIQTAVRALLASKAAEEKKA